jgi:hypothetical protein
MELNGKGGDIAGPAYRRRYLSAFSGHPDATHRAVKIGPPCVASGARQEIIIFLHYKIKDFD